MGSPKQRMYRTTRDIVIPKGHPLVYVGTMRHHITGAVTAVVKVAPDIHFDWFMNKEEAMQVGLIEEAGKKR